MTNRIFCHFGLFFALSPPLQPEKSKLQKEKEKKSGYIIILQ